MITKTKIITFHLREQKVQLLAKSRIKIKLKWKIKYGEQKKTWTKILK